MSVLFRAFIDRVRRMGPVGLSLVEAFDEASLLAVSEAEAEGFVTPFLVGDVDRIREVMESKGIRLANPVFVDARDRRSRREEAWPLSARRGAGS